MEVDHSSVKATTEYFDHLISMVPVSFYFSISGKMANQKYWQHTNVSSTKHSLRMNLHEKTKSALIGDDLGQKTVSQMLEEGFEPSESSDEATEGIDGDDYEDIGSQDGSMEDEENQPESEDEDEDKESDESDNSDEGSDDDTESDGINFVASGSIKGVNISAEHSHLRSKLLSKINASRHLRKVAPLGDDGTPLRDDDHPKSKRKTKMETKAAKEGKPLLSKREMKNMKKRKRKEEALRSMHKPPPKPSHTSSSVEREHDSDMESSRPAKRKKVAEDLDFGKMHFEDGHSKTHFETKKRKKSKEELLGKLEKERDRVRELKGTEEGEQMQKDSAWKRSFQRMEGEKVKDDIQMLKKSIKREEHAKKKSRKEWRERTDSVKKSQEEVRKKRSVNIRERLDAVKLKRMGKKGSSKKSKK